MVIRRIPNGLAVIKTMPILRQRCASPSTISYCAPYSNNPPVICAAMPTLPLPSFIHLYGDFGFEADWYPEIAFPFQNHVIGKSTKKGRIGIFGDTGLGKTLIACSVAYNIVRHENKPVLILTTIAVAFQFLSECEKIGIDEIEHTKNCGVS